MSYLKYTATVFCLMLIVACGNKSRKLPEASPTVNSASDLSKVVDPLYPTTSVSLAAGYYNYDPVIGINCLFAGSACPATFASFASSNGLAPTAADQTTSVTLTALADEEISYTVKYYSSKVDGTNKEGVRSAVYVVDKKNPTVQIFPPFNTGYLTTQSIEILMSESGKIFYTLNDPNDGLADVDPKSLTTANLSASCPIPGPGEYCPYTQKISLSQSRNILYFAQDLAGNNSDTAIAPYVIGLVSGNIGSSAEITLNYVAQNNPVTVKLDKNALQAIVDAGNDMKVLDLDITDVLDSGLQAVQSSTGLTGTAFNLQKLLNATPVTIDLSGTPISGLLPLVDYLGLEGGSANFVNRLLGRSSTQLNDSVLPIPVLRDGLMQNLISVHYGVNNSRYSNGTRDYFDNKVWDYYFINSTTGAYCKRGIHDSCTTTNAFPKSIEAGVSENLKSVAYNNGVYIMVGSTGRILSSTDAFNWAIFTSPTASPLNKILFAGNRFVIIGDGGTILVSTDNRPTAFTVAASGVSVNLNDIAYINGEFIVVGDGVLLSSSNGSAWTSRFSAIAGLPSAASNPLTAITYTNGYYLLAGHNNVVATSSNLSSFNPVTATLPCANATTLVVMTNRTVVGCDSGQIYITRDFSLWNLQASLPSPVRQIIYANSHLRALTNNGNIYISASGHEWDLLQSYGVNSNGIAYLQNYFFVLSDSATFNLTPASGTIPVYISDVLSNMNTLAGSDIGVRRRLGSSCLSGTCSALAGETAGRYYGGFITKPAPGNCGPLQDQPCPYAQLITSGMFITIPAQVTDEIRQGFDFTQLASSNRDAITSTSLSLDAANLTISGLVPNATLDLAATVTANQAVNNYLDLAPTNQRTRNTGNARNGDHKGYSPVWGLYPNRRFNTEFLVMQMAYYYFKDLTYKGAGGKDYDYGSACTSSGAGRVLFPASSYTGALGYPSGLPANIADVTTSIKCADTTSGYTDPTYAYNDLSFHKQFLSSSYLLKLAEVWVNTTPQTYFSPAGQSNSDDSFGCDLKFGGYGPWVNIWTPVSNSLAGGTWWYDGQQGNNCYSKQMFGFYVHDLVSMVAQRALNASGGTKNATFTLRNVPIGLTLPQMVSAIKGTFTSAAGLAALVSAGTILFPGQSTAVPDVYIERSCGATSLGACITADTAPHYICMNADTSGGAPYPNHNNAGVQYAKAGFYFQSGSFDPVTDFVPGNKVSASFASLAGAGILNAKGTISTDECVAISLAGGETYYVQTENPTPRAYRVDMLNSSATVGKNAHLRWTRIY